MSEVAWTFVGTISGILIGSGLAIVKTRNEVYGKYIGSCNAYFIALCEVSRAVHRDHPKLPEASRTSEHLRTEGAALKGQLDMLAGSSTRAASDQMQTSLDELNALLYERIRKMHEVPPPEPLETERLRVDYKLVQDGFLNAVNQELKIRR